MKPDVGQFELERRYGISPDRLWRLLTDPAMRAKWGAPSEGTVLVVEKADLRVGGRRANDPPASMPKVARGGRRDA